MNINIKKYGKGYPLVFFHGWGFDTRIWLPLVPKLEMSYELILVDLPGFGQSSMMGWELFKEKLLNELPDQFAVIGWSMGGLYAMRLATEMPERVAHLVGIASSPRFLFDDDVWPGISRDVFSRFYKNLSEDPGSTLKEFLLLHGLKHDAEQEPLPDLLPDVSGLSSGLHVLETWDLRGDIRHFANPACFIFGRLDPIVPVKTMQQMQLIYPQFNYVLFKRAAHMPFLSHTDLFIEELQGFIQ